MKAIIVDLDRTLLHTDKTISDYTDEILSKCKSKGYKIIAATARPIRTAKKFDDIIGFDALAVSNGARLIYNGIVSEFGITDEDCRHLFKNLNKYPELRITLETGDTAYSNKPIEDYFTVISDDLYGASKKYGALKLIISNDRDKVISIVQEALTDNLYYTIANGHLVQIMSKSATKWNGIKSILNMIGITPEDSVYFGDDNDDIEPIKNCGIGVAMSNAIETVKSAADYITDSNDEDGVAKFIEKNILCDN